MSQPSKSIPDMEMNQFQPYIHIFSGGEVILLEGKTDDDSLFLLREGTVNIYKKSGDENKLVSTIEAVNFFGEMSLIMGGPRSATVVAATDEVVVYILHRDEINTVLSNPIWSELLVSRLINNLKIANNQIIRTVDETQAIKNKYDDLVDNMALLFQAYHEITQKIIKNQEIPDKFSDYLTALDQMYHSFLGNHYPEIDLAIQQMDESSITILDKRQILPKLFKPAER